MPASARHAVGRPDRRARVAVAVAVVAIAVGVVLALAPGGRSARDSARAAGASSPSAPVARVSTGWTSGLTTMSESASKTSPSLQAPVDPSASPQAVGVPVRLIVPRLHIDTSLDKLDVNSHGVLQTPRSFHRAAWFAQGTRPGDVGPAVIAGHVDSRSGPAVFFTLKQARVGDEIEVRDSVGVLRRFEVTALRQYAKTSFATTEVYGPTALPQLRLITCTGVFDEAARSYRDNLVVFATVARTRAG